MGTSILLRIMSFDYMARKKYTESDMINVTVVCLLVGLSLGALAVFVITPAQNVVLMPELSQYACFCDCGCECDINNATAEECTWEDLFWEWETVSINLTRPIVGPLPMDRRFGGN